MQVVQGVGVVSKPIKRWKGFFGEIFCEGWVGKTGGLQAILRIICM